MSPFDIRAGRTYVSNQGELLTVRDIYGLGKWLVRYKDATGMVFSTSLDEFADMAFHEYIQECQGE